MSLLISVIYFKNNRIENKSVNSLVSYLKDYTIDEQDLKEELNYLTYTLDKYSDLLEYQIMNVTSKEVIINLDIKQYRKDLYLSIVIPVTKDKEYLIK